jgi:hypothetical protein
MSSARDDNRKSFIRTDHGPTGSVPRDKGKDTEFKRQPKWAGALYSGGMNFDSHIAEFTRSLKSSGKMNNQQECEYFLSSLDPTRRRFAKTLIPDTAPQSIEKYIANIRRFVPKSTVRHDRFEPLRTRLAARTRIGPDMQACIAELLELQTEFNNLKPTEAELISFGDDILRRLKEISPLVKKVIGDHEYNTEAFAKPVPAKDRFITTCTMLLRRLEDDPDLNNTEGAKRQNQPIGSSKSFQRQPGEEPPRKQSRSQRSMASVHEKRPCYQGESCNND